LEEQFRQAQKMEAVGRLAGGVAHDFNNLLTVITGYSDLLLGGTDLKESQRTALQEVRRSAERGGALTNQLLAFSRRQPLQTRLVHVNDLVMQIERLLRRLIGEDVELITIPAAGSDVVAADTGRLEQVIMNLAVNARDAMPNGGKLTIETGTRHLSEAVLAKQLGVEPGRFVTIAITDTGTGMDADTQSHLFEPFFTTKSASRGTGLSLATAYGIVRQSGGAIGFTSQVGAGTTAFLYLPMAEDRTEAAGERGTADERLTGAETILLVEDETRVRKLIVDVLAARGYRVLEATRGADAIRLCRISSARLPRSSRRCASCIFRGTPKRRWCITASNNRAPRFCRNHFFPTPSPARCGKCSTAAAIRLRNRKLSGVGQALSPRKSRRMCAPA